MTIDECKTEAIAIFTDLGVMIPYEPDLLPDDWQALSDELADYASTIGRMVSRIAAYSSIAARKANSGEK